MPQVHGGWRAGMGRAQRSLPPGWQQPCGAGSWPGSGQDTTRHLQIISGVKTLHRQILPAVKPACQHRPFHSLLHNCARAVVIWGAVLWHSSHLAPMGRCEIPVSPCAVVTEVWGTAGASSAIWCLRLSMCGERNKSALLCRCKKSKTLPQCSRVEGLVNI